MQKVSCPCSGKYNGPEPQRLAVLKFAAFLGASHIDVELQAAQYFFAGEGTSFLASIVTLSPCAAHSLDSWVLIVRAVC